MEVKGIVEKIFEPTTRGNYTSKKIWVTTKDQYPQTYEIECGGKQERLFDGLQINQEVTIQTNIKGRKWEKDGKEMIFHSIQAWRIESVAKGNNQQAPSATNQPFTNPEPGADDLPF